MSKQPNIIICTADQLRWSALGCYGNEYVKTPNLDRLALEGIRFENGITNAPVCMAARSVLLSGQYNRRCTGGVENVSFKCREGSFDLPEYPSEGRPHLPDPTLPEALRSIGYHTATIGKWHIHSWPDDIGFDYYLIPRVHHVHTGQSYTENGAEEFVPAGYSVDFEMERVDSFLQKQKDTAEKFFLYYNISPPHCPLADAPERYLNMYRPENVPLQPNVNPDEPLSKQDYWFRVYRYDFRYYSLALPYTMQVPDQYSLRHLIAEYYGLTTWVDDTVGRLMESLERTGLREDTIVLFTSDHGDNLGSHGLVQKGSPNDESIRVPYILCGPIPDGAPSVIDTHVPSLVDVAPTLLDICGVRAPITMDGTSMAPVLAGNPEKVDRTWSITETGRGTAVRTPGRLFCVPKDGERRLGEEPIFLYDTARDPYQMDNMAEDPAAREAHGDLARLLREWDDRTPWMTD